MNYIPERGDIVWIDFNPQMGHEQAKRRPAIVLTPSIYNQKSKLLICVPLTTKEKGYPFEVAIKSEESSIALADQVKSLDWQARRAEYKGRASKEEIEQIKEKIKTLLTL